MKFISCILLVLLATINTGCGGGASSQTQTPPPPSPQSQPSISSLHISPSSMSIGTGATQQFKATAQLSNGFLKDVTSAVQWSSTDATVASISATGLANASSSGSVTITATSGTVTATATLNVNVAATNLVSIAIAPAASSMPVNTSQQFTALGTYNDGSTADLTSLVSWSSSSTAIATITPKGMVSSVAGGTTNISASLANVSQTTSLSVTVPTIVSIAVTPVGLTLGIGINQQFVATATYSDGSSDDLSSAVTWTSSTPAVATVNNSGLVTTVAAGSSTITATVGSLSDNSLLTVVPAHLISIAVNPATSSIALGTAQQFSAVGTFDDGSTQLLPSVTWSSSATSVASVDVNGVASGVTAGTATITAASGSVNGSASLTVNGASLVSIALAPANSSMAVGTTVQFSATGTFSDSSTQDISASVLWSSSNSLAATISSGGLASSSATGNTTIKAEFGSVSGSTNLAVSTAHLVSITINPANPTIAARTSLKFTASGTFSDGSVASNLAGVSWKSSKPSIASLRSSGIAHGKKVGSATISASASGVTGTTTLTVGSGTLVSLAITPVAPTASVGTTQQFAATGNFSDGSSQDISLNSHWSSSSASVATIANAPSVAGQANCLGVGTSVIGANSGGTTGSATLTVQ